MLKMLQIIMFPILVVLSFLYGLIIRIRHLLYDIGILASYKPETYTISIGNISVGGTGKTPITAAVVEDLQKNGYRCVIISRGYKRKSEGLIVVSDGKNILKDAMTAGDEPYLLAKSTNVPVICSEDRLKAAEVAVDRFKADFIVLDDGFQHRRLRRDFDLVAIDSLRFLGNHLLLPAGILRDHISRLSKAEVLILTKTEKSSPSRIKKQIAFLQKFGKKVILTKTIATGLSNGKESLELSDIENKNIALFCGLGLPANFYAFFTKNKISFTQSYPDHHRYSEEELDTMMDRGRMSNCDYIITTEKDFYNFPAKWKKPINLFYLAIKLEFCGTEGESIPLTRTIFNTKL